MLYAYDNRLLDDGTDITSGLYNEGEWAVRNWSGDGTNTGRLLADQDIYFQTYINPFALTYINSSDEEVNTDYEMVYDINKNIT